MARILATLRAHGRTARRTVLRAISGTRRSAAVAVALGLLSLLALGTVYVSLTPSCAGEACPAIGRLDEYRPPEPAHVYDRRGALAGHLRGPRRIVVSLERVPRVLSEGFVAVEDRRFRQHHGIDFRGVARALTSNVAAGRAVEGASTLTMQLARNVFGSDVLEYSKWRRKATEVRLALAMEARLTKDEILELYLNQIYLGDGVYGVGAAARRYFDKPVSRLAPAEAALLIGLAKSPEGYNPRRHPRRALQRRDVVLSVLAREGVLTAEEARSASATALDVSQHELVWDAGSYFAGAVQRELTRILPDRGARAGVRVHTGLDPELQRRAEEVLHWQIRRIEEGSYGRFDAPVPGGDTAEAAAGASPFLQGMVVSLDPATGAVRALVGGRDYASTPFDRAFLARRQPGSAFKPIVYAAALADGVTHAHLVSLDSITVAPVRGEPATWHLADAAPEGAAARHHVGVRDALVRSSNVATVRLGSRLGVGRVVEQARAVGFSTPIPSYPSIFLGTAEVVPAELVAAYAAFGNRGRRVRPHLIRRIEDPRGRVIWRAPEEEERALTPETAFLVRSALQDVVDRGTGWRARAQGYRGPAAGKTGTTNEGRDVWFVGTTPGLTTGVWLGFDRPRTIVPGGSGGRLAAPIWGRLMARTDRETRADGKSWSVPDGIVRARIDVTSGYLATDDCPGSRIRNEYFEDGSQPRAYCPLHGRNFLERIAAEIKEAFGRETARRLELPPR